MSDCSRRRALAGLTGTFAGVVGGCAGVLERDSEPGTAGAEANPPWSSVMYDSQNTGHAPDQQGPGDRPSNSWNRHVGNVTVNVSAPAVVDGTVYAGGGPFQALSAEDGSREWRYPPADRTDSSPAVADGRVFVGGTDGAIHAIDAETGEGIWSVASERGSLVGSSPTVRDRTVYAAGAWGTVFAIDAAKGTVRWRFDPPEDRDDPGDGKHLVGSAPAVADGTVYVGGRYLSDAGDYARLYALDAATGEEKWRFAPNSDGGNRVSTPAVAGGRVYATVTGRGILAFDARSGAVEWELTARRAVGWNGVVSSPAVANGVVYATGGTRRLYAVSAANGEERWRVDFDEGSAASPVVADGTVYQPGIEDETDPKPHLDAFDAATGERRWRYDLWTRVNATPAVVDGTIYCGGYNRVFALSASGDR